MNATLITAIFTCLTPSHLAFNLQVGHPQHYLRLGTVYFGEATALHAGNVAIKAEPVSVLGTPIRTRTVVGEQFEAELPGNVKVSLRNITYVPQGFESQLGTSGVATLPGGEQLPLACQSNSPRGE